jgi:cytochrome c2
MKRLFKFLFRTLLVLIALVAIAALIIYFRGIPSYEITKIDLKVESTPERVQRGQKLAYMLCAGCHKDPETGKMIGKHMKDAPPEFGTIYSANITQDKTYGIGNYTDGELLYLLRTGIKRDGKYAPPYMAKLPNMADEDIYSIIAYLRSNDPSVAATAVADKQSEPSLLTKFLCTVEFEPLPLPKGKIEFPDTTDQVALGRYLAHNLDCFTCHSADFKTLNILEPEKTPGYFAGGNKPLNMEGKVMLTANITPDKATGIGNWSEKKFIDAVKYGLKEGEHVNGLRSSIHLQISANGTGDQE